MKKILFLWMCSFVLSQFFAQPFEKKQITSFDFDSRGASFPVYLVLGFSTFLNPPLFFEAHQDNHSNVMMISYDQASDSFSNPINITNNSYWNIKPIAESFENYSNRKINLIWQTNENGNWDIVLRTITDSAISENKFLLSSSNDETNPQFVLKKIWEPFEYDIEIVYERNNSIYLYQQKDSSINNELVFSGNDSVRFLKPTGVHANAAPWTPPAGLYIAAVCQFADSTSKIVYRYKPVNDSIWSDIYTAFDSGYCENPKFFNNYSLPFLSLESRIDSIKRILVLPGLGSLGNNHDAEPLIDEPKIISSDLESFQYTFVTNEYILDKPNNVRQLPFYDPHTFKIMKNDSVYAVFCSNYWLPYEFFYTGVNDTRVVVGNVGIDNNFMAISYTVWEDSSDGHINLFGAKRLDPLGDVNDKIIANSFILYQNYPNPFNPKTVIKYELLARDFVTLKVYDILGNEVAALVNEEKDAGVYNSIFDGINLASGIYIYRLSVGNFHLSKKMILLK